METYAIIRFYQGNTDRETIESGLTRAEAQEHCRDSETSSSTCESAEGIARTAAKGAWFDGFEAE